MGEEKISLYSSTTLSICFFRVGEPCLEAMTKIFFFPYARIVMKKKFLVWEKILLHCFAVLKEMAEGDTTSSVLYNLFPKVIITE